MTAHQTIIVQASLPCPNNLGILTIMFMESYVQEEEEEEGRCKAGQRDLEIVPALPY